MSRSLLLCLLIPMSVGAQKVAELPNDRFAMRVGDLRPLLWKDYEPMQKNVYACINDNKMSTAICEKVSDRMYVALYDAISQALVVNALAKDDDPKFCDSYGEKLVIDRKIGPTASYALLILDKRMKYGSSLYGAELPNVYVGKILHDALLETKPSKP